MFALPQDYATAQDAGKTFAVDYYGRLNASSAESVADMFADRSRYYTMDSLDGRPAVGRADVFREVRRFLRTHGGRGRVVRIVSVDAQTDGGDSDDNDDDGGGGPAKKYFYGEYGCGDEDDCDSDYGGEDDDRLRLAVFVRAEWTGPRPQPFVQTFTVRCLPSDRRDRFEIVTTVVKMMATALVRPPDSHSEGFSYSGHEASIYETPIREQFEQETYAADYHKQLNAEAREFELWSDVKLQARSALAESLTDDDEPELTEAEESLMAQEILDFQEQMEKFVEKSMAELRPPPTTYNTDMCDDHFDDDDDDGDHLPTDRMHVDRLDKAVTADQLYAAFGRYGRVLWVRVIPGGFNRGNSARVCFEETKSVDMAMDDHRSLGCTINGVRVSFSRSKSGQ